MYAVLILTIGNVMFHTLKDIKKQTETKKTALQSILLVFCFVGNYV